MRQPASGRSSALGFLILMIGISGCATSHPAPGPIAITAPSTAPSVSDLTEANAYMGPIPRRLRIISLIDEPDDWFRTDKGRQIVDNIVGWQNANGGWWKNYDP